MSDIKKLISIIIPVYNESESIGFLLDEVINVMSFHEFNFELIVVNDGSKDNTHRVLKELTLKIKELSVISLRKNYGQTAAMSAGFDNSKGDIIITLDGDGQNDPRDIPKLLDLYNTNDNIKLVGGIRKKRQDSYIKIFSSKIANYIRSKILSDNCKDTGCSLKVFSKNIFLEFPYFDGMHRFLPALFKGYSYNTTFIEVNHRKRKYGISKYGTINRLFKGIKDIIRVKRIIKNYKKI